MLSKRLINTGSGALPPPFIGQFRDGGIVYYINPSDPNQGMVMAISYVGTKVWQDNFNSVPDNIDFAIGSDFVNTSNIIAALGSGTYAAKAARDYNYGGYSDWSLPTVGSLDAIYANRSLLSTSSIDAGGQSLTWTSQFGSRHWSSNNQFYLNAFFVNFYNGADGLGDVSGGFLVRPVRAFQL